MWQYNNPVHITFTKSFLLKLKNILKAKKKILLVCSKRFTNTIEFKQIQEDVSNIEIYTEIENDPSFCSCDRAIEYADAIKPDTIIAIGGGSVIDTAKAIRLALMSDCINISQMLKSRVLCKNKIKFIAIPTTHGTSSELTKWATIWNKIEKKKYSLSHDENYPDNAIYDYHFVQSLPLDISLITTLDALSHSFEALWNKNANPISDDHAIKAIKLIYENIGKLNKNIERKTREQLLLSTVYAGLAFSNTKTAASHSISYPLTSLHDIPHGIACSMTLKKIFQLNFPFMTNKVRKLFNELEISQINKLWDEIYSSIDGKLKYSLSAFGINDEDLDELVTLCFTKGRMENNIKELTEEDVRKILEEIL